MCYESAQLAERIYRDAVRAGASEEELDYLRRNWEEKKRHKPTSKYYHVSGFEHPDLVAFYKKDDHLEVDHFTWGLIPHWVKDANQATDIWNKTLNARGETIFEKPSFKDAAQNSRVIIPLDGFFEHHHKNGKTFPHYIQQKDGESMLVAGLSSHWTNPSTGEIIPSLSIVTTKGNELMSEIHNNPKLNGPRMPLILNESNVRTWMEGDENEVEKLMRPSNVEITAHTVRRLKGRNALGNVPEVQQEYRYPEMDDPLTLF
ncbi:MAG: SOS response-associated peptidase [bacterium]|nr:SOS response-associated peptidase [bacterium]